MPRSKLGERLYGRLAMERYVATEAGKVIGHALIEPANPAHVDAWGLSLGAADSTLVEMGGAFVEPSLSGQGIWTSLLLHRIDVIRKRSAVPVTATWSVNEHVKRTFQKFGGVQAGRQSTSFGDVDLFVF
jgi:GNAT superfamily N-acetyltransferase